MDIKELIKNNIIFTMKTFLDSQTLTILQNVIDKEFSNAEISQTDNLPATTDDVNQYIVNLFMNNKAPKLSKKTVDYYTDSIKRLVLYIDKPLTKVTSTDIDRFLTSLMNENESVSTNNHRRNISAFFTWMRKSHMIIENPCESVEPYKEVKRQIDHLEPEEYEQLKEGCTSKRDRALIEFMRSTAMRVGEIEKIRICDINWQTGWQEIYGEKTSTYRLVGCDPVCLMYLKEYILKERKLQLTSKEPLFVAVKGNQSKSMCGGGFRAVLKSIQERAGLTRKIYPHLFRKTTATNIVKRGGSIHDAGEYLGHRDRSVTGQHYTYISHEHTKEIFDKYVACL